ncbi:MAG TPA: cell division protein ZipA C-terminal FtsZ-binding domain-containing protein [Rubrivivax sp.]|nr:cell division protein ZipA C-terminal FtsZ-binding domain-containing protein [Rubrivivax sp.]HPO19707.1 cell division protein ZipA C-terminal FtsZ-binding domain-containing protein [Rubrivivax sp.]
MSLTAALAILGAVVLLALLLHGWWKTRRAGPRQAEPALPAAQRVEPALGDAAQAHGAQAAAPQAGEAAPRRAPGARPPARLDALIDAIVPLSLEAPVSGELVLSQWPATRRAGTKPFHIEGLNLDSGEWEQPAAGQRYGELQAGVQLANRSGALNEIEYSEFVQKLQTFAEGVGAMADFPDMLQVVARARELDALAGPLDAQLAVRLVARSVAWSVGYVLQCAGRHGLLLGAVPGRLVLPALDEGAPPQLVLEFDAQAALADEAQAAPLREVILSLDVPQTEAALDPFPSWHRIAHALAEDMDAVLLDDAGRPITLQAFDAIGKDLAKLYQTLESHDLAAGSAAARRLFAG